VTKLLSLAAAIGVSFFCVAATSAMPLAPLEQLQTNLTIPVAGGCALLFKVLSPVRNRTFRADQVTIVAWSKSHGLP
jgi:hypothetical protein